MATQLNTTTSIVDYLKSKKKPYSYSYRKKEYEKMGLESRLGSYTGAGQQNTALLNLLKEGEEKALTTTSQEQQLADITAKTEAIKSQLGQMTALKEAGYQITPTTEVAPTPELSKAFPELAETKEGALRFSPETKQVEQYTPEKEWQPSPKPTPTQTATPTLTTTNITNIVDQITTGKIKIPEVEIAKEATELAKGQAKEKVKQALSITQQRLAKQGMTFSGIRTKAEQGIQAEHLAEMSGISLRLAETILSAARQEEKRRQPTYREIGGALYELRPGQEPQEIIKAPPKEAETFTYQGRVFIKDPETNEWKIEYESPPANIETRIINNINSAVDQYRLNPEGFRERYIKSLISAYGEQYRNYITQQVYALMPDIISEPTKVEESELNIAIKNWLETEGANFSDEEKREMIIKSGGNPADFDL